MNRPDRPALKPGLRRLRRGPTTLQLGLGERHAVVVTDAGPEVGAFLDKLDGSRTGDALLAAAREAKLDPDVALGLVDRLGAHGALLDASVGRPVRGLSAAERDRLAPDLAAWGLATRAPGGGSAVHARRHAARVDVHGAGRVGALAAALLTHAGVGELHVHDSDPLRAGDVPAAWARTVPADVGAAPARGAVALDVCEQLAPSLRTNRRRSRGTTKPPDLALLAPVDTAGTVDLELRDALMRAGVPHLPAFVRETVGVVGPFVVPGRTACLRCVDLARTDRDHDWPRVLAQLTPLPATARARRTAVPPPDAGDGVLAVSVAAQAVLQILAVIDGATPSAAGRSIETDLIEGTTRARAWQQHPACGCGWD